MSFTPDWSRVIDPELRATLENPLMFVWADSRGIGVVRYWIANRETRQMKYIGQFQANVRLEYLRKLYPQCRAIGPWIGVFLDTYGPEGHKFEKGGKDD
jgi:hypothetical protein